MNHRQFGPLPNRPPSNRPQEKSILIKLVPLEITTYPNRPLENIFKFIIYQSIILFSTGGPICPGMNFSGADLTRADFFRGPIHPAPFFICKFQQTQFTMILLCITSPCKILVNSSLLNILIFIQQLEMVL